LEDYAPAAQLLAFLVEGQPPPAVALLSQILATLDSYVFLSPPPPTDLPANNTG